MGKSLIGLGVIIILGLAGILAHGEPDAPNPEKTATPSGSYQAPDHLRIAVIDIAYIYKKDKQFLAKIDEMKVKVAAAEAELTDDEKAEVIKMRKTPPDTKSGELSMDKTKLGEKVGKQRAEFMQEEGVIYYDAMERIKTAIKQCCQQHDIQFVYRVDTSPVDPTNRNDILRGINVPIPYYDSNLNITQEVLTALNDKDSDAAN